MKLCLGTVQLGQRYGINNQIGRQPTLQESFDILNTAIDAGIDTFDTSSHYGEAEDILGAFFRRYPERKNQVKIVSKLGANALEGHLNDIQGTIRRNFETSLKRINVEHLEGYLIHTQSYIYIPEVIETIKDLQTEGLASKVGMSLYDTKEGYMAIETGFMNAIQMPYNILDQRGIKEGFIHKAKMAGFTIGTRSAFLQGLLQMNSEQIETRVPKAVPYINLIKSILLKYGIENTSEACLGFVKAENDIDFLVFGVDTKEQLLANIKAFNDSKLPKGCLTELKKSIEDVEDAVIYPSKWENSKETVSNR